MHKEGLEITMTQLNSYSTICIPLDSIRVLKLQLLDHNYMYIHNNLHNQLNYNFHIRFLATVLSNKFVI